MPTNMAQFPQVPQVGQYHLCDFGTRPRVLKVKRMTKKHIKHTFGWCETEEFMKMSHGQVVPSTFERLYNLFT